MKKIVFILLFSSSFIFANEQIKECIVKYDICVEECKQADGCISEAEECLDICKYKRKRCIVKVKNDT